MGAPPGLQKEGFTAGVIPIFKSCSSASRLFNFIRGLFSVFGLRTKHPWARCPLDWELG